MDNGTLMKKALEARKNAYVPFSNFRVGAALLTRDEKVYTGCNIENASYGATNCAERTAIFKALSEGERDFEAIAITSDSEQITYPCGICRQVIAEFKIPKIVVGNKHGEYREYTLEEILPFAFGLDQMNA